MSKIVRAQISEIEFLTQHPVDTRKDTLSDLSYLRYMLPADDVLEILGVIALGVKEV